MKNHYMEMHINNHEVCDKSLRIIYPKVCGKIARCRKDLWEIL